MFLRTQRTGSAHMAPDPTQLAAPTITPAKRAHAHPTIPRAHASLRECNMQNTYFPSSLVAERCQWWRSFEVVDFGGGPRLGGSPRRWKAWCERAREPKNEEKARDQRILAPRLFKRRILTSRFQNHQSHGHGTRRPESPPTGGPTSESCPHGTRISTHRLPDNATNDTANTAGAAAAATFNAGTSRGQCVRRHRWKIGRDERGASGEGIGGGSGSGGSDGVMEIRLRSPAFGLSPICVSVTADSGRSAHTAQTL